VSKKTVSLEESAYHRLKAAKAPHESFSQVVHRILADPKPSFRSLAGVLTTQEAKEIQEAVKRMRTQEARAEARRFGTLRVTSGSRSRH
jgi:predicted CopG family antitoxin